MAETQHPDVNEKSGSGPLIMLYSLRERIRDILTIGLTQCDYRLILAQTPYLAMIKISQFIPALVILDITADNTKDLILVARMRKTMRTRHIPVLLVIPPDVRRFIETLHAQEGDSAGHSQLGLIHTREYPFNFSELLGNIKEMLFDKEERSKNAPHVDAEANAAATAKKLFDPSVPADKKLMHIESSLQRQWAFPHTVIKAIDIIESDASCCSELARCIATDVSASAAILRVANTVYYARRGGKRVTDIQDAVVRLGFRETRNLLGCMALIDLSPDLYSKYGFSRQDFWLHSLSTALIAEKLCMDCDYRRSELAFLAGLVHDLGKIPIDNNYPPVFSHLLEEASNTIQPFFAAEEKLMGFSHADLAHFLGNRWNFPPQICQTLLHHHAPEKIAATARPSDRILMASVYVANILTKAIGIGHSCDEIIREIPPLMLKDLNISAGISEKFISVIFHNLHLLCRYLNISTKDMFMSKARTGEGAVEIAVVYSKSISFHPITIALRSRGYDVRACQQLTPDVCRKCRVAVFVTQKGMPLDLMIYEDEGPEDDGANMLKIFLLDAVADRTATKDLIERNIVFMDRNHLDIHMLLHTIDNFLQHVVAPERQEIDITEKGPM